MKKLIDLSHSQYSAVKLTVADKIPSYLKDFPDIEDEAINAVYDLCEDSDPNVRMFFVRVLLLLLNMSKLGSNTWVPYHQCRIQGANQMGEA